MTIGFIFNVLTASRTFNVIELLFSIIFLGVSNEPLTSAFDAK